ncbi:MAG: hypothetical protein IPM61_12795 [Chlorobi bacterium]|nr:hypothetical protein [Chlorobiota bacterium]MBX7215912.1 hypothetical protein [Candidatus Kapabacteria bacterium]
MKKSLNFLHGFFLALVLLACGGQALAQQFDPETTGRKFFIAFPKVVANLLDERFANKAGGYFAHVFSDRDSNTLRVKNLQTGTDTTYVLRKWKGNMVNFGVNPTVATTDAPTNATWLLEAEYPVIVYCSYFGQFGGEAWTPIPVERWGKEYHAASRPGTAVLDFHYPSSDSLQTTLLAAPPQLLIIADRDNTSITIDPSIGGPISPIFSAEPFTVHLNAGEAYQATGYVDVTKYPTQVQPLLSGVRIVADNPISVISGNPRSDGDIRSKQVTGNSGKNPGYEVLTPVEQHGKEFVFLPTWDLARVMGTPGEDLQKKREFEVAVIQGTRQDSLTLTYQKNGDEESRKFNNRGGGEVKIELPQPVAFHTTQPSQGMKYSTGAGSYSLRYQRDTATGAFDSSTVIQYSSRSTAAPYMLELTPREQWTSVAPFFALGLPTITHYLNVVADSISAKRISLVRREFGKSDNIVSEVSTPVVFNRGVIPGTDLVWTTLQPNPGVHYCLVGADSLVRFWATLSGGYEGSEAYAPQRGGIGEYQEFAALSYGLPLAPRRSAINPPTTGVETDAHRLQFSLRSLSANPFTGVAEVLLELPTAAAAKVEITDVIGRSVALMLQGEAAAGGHQLRWDATDASPGLYFCRAVVGRKEVVLPLKVIGKW